MDEDRICTVGVNMGFGGLIYGASELKKQADLEGQPIAWITAARCGDERLSELVPKAAGHGSFVWLLDATDTDPRRSCCWLRPTRRAPSVCWLTRPH